MKLLTSRDEIASEFQRLLNQYSRYYWAVAWAGATFDLCSELLLNKEKISQIVVGLHFYQTHPEFIKCFLGNERVKFYSDTEGIFHPKLYLFENSQDDWEIFIGSANFTNSAFHRNSEVVCLIRSSDANREIRENAKKYIQKYSNRGAMFDKFRFAEYQEKWSTKKERMEDLTEEFSIQKKTQSVDKKSVGTLDWDEYYERVKIVSGKSLTPRLKILQMAKEMFSVNLQFRSFSDDERKKIAGLTVSVVDGIDWGLFGRMTASGGFKGKVYENDENISNALDAIPLTGKIEIDNYMSFIKEFKKISDSLILKAGATRLLAMKRPDEFVCIDGKNLPKMNLDFNRKKNYDPNYEEYWHKIIVPIRETEWYNAPEPFSSEQKDIWKGRVAMIDALYYDSRG